MVDGDKNSVVNWVMKLNLFMCIFYFIFYFEDSHSVHLFLLLFGLDTYKHA